MIEKYVVHGKLYEKIKRTDIIKEGAMHSLDNGELKPIMAFDTVGDKPSSFSDQRDFYNPVDHPGDLCPSCRDIDCVKCERTDIPDKPFKCVCCGKEIKLDSVKFK